MKQKIVIWKQQFLPKITQIQPLRTKRQLMILPVVTLLGGTKFLKAKLYHFWHRCILIFLIHHVYYHLVCKRKFKEKTLNFFTIILIFSGVNLRLRLLRASDQFCLLAADSGKYKIKLIDVKLQLRKLQVAPEIFTKHMALFERGNLCSIPFHQAKIQTILMPKGCSNHNLGAVISKFIFICSN